MDSLCDEGFHNCNQTSPACIEKPLLFAHQMSYILQLMLSHLDSFPKSCPFRLIAERFMRLPVPFLAFFVAVVDSLASGALVLGWRLVAKRTSPRILGWHHHEAMCKLPLACLLVLFDVQKHSLTFPYKCHTVRRFLWFLLVTTDNRSLHTSAALRPQN
jgi:hypothetical protein